MQACKSAACPIAQGVQCASHSLRQVQSFWDPHRGVAVLADTLGIEAINLAKHSAQFSGPHMPSRPAKTG